MASARKVGSSTGLVVAATIVAMAQVTACKGGGDDGEAKEEAGTDPAVATDTATNTDTTNSAGTPGVTAATGDTVVVSGQLALSAALTEGGARKIAGFMVSKGEVNTREFLSADVAEDGTFSLDLSSKSKDLIAIESADNGDGTYDRVKLSEALGQTIDDDTTDAMITEYVAEMKAAAESGGLSYVVVSYIASGDKRAEAESFRFIGLAKDGVQLNAIPTAFAKGNLGLGKISDGEGDEATAELPLDDKAFDLPADVLAEMARLSAMLKSVRNAWINGDKVRTMPFFAHNIDMATAWGQYTVPGDAQYAGWGMYIGVRDAGFSWDQICDGANEGKLILAPPAAIDAGGTIGTISPDRPFDNGGLGAIQTESSRSNCGGSDTGFYGAGEPGGGADDDIMVNWGTGGMTDVIPEGFWSLKWDGATAGEFELGTAAIFDADGVPSVYRPAVKITKGDDGVITRVDVKLFRPTSVGWEEMTDPTAFLQSVSRSCYLDGGNREDHRYSLLGHVTGGVFTLEAADLRGDDDAVQSWKAPGSAGTADYEADIGAVYFEMFGSSYRLGLGNGGGGG